MDATRRRAGLLLHPTSLSGPHGIGCLGIEAERLLDWMTEAGIRVWQVLPLGPPGLAGSPYNSWSAFGKSPWLIDLRPLVADGLLAEDEIAGGPETSDGFVEYAAMRAFKGPRLRKAGERLVKDGGRAFADDLAALRARAAWLRETALFQAIRWSHEERAWWTWEPALRHREPDALARAAEDLAADIATAEAIQVLVDRQWRALHARCAERGVEVLGDIPIYVAPDSDAVWSRRDLFRMDADGRAREVAGVPPDAFSETGQLWGNPVYDWEACEREGFAWWIERTRAALADADLVRIDHFRGFAAYWSIPAGALDAREGRWVEGPGLKLFDALRGALGPLPVIAEDLGIIDEPTRQLLKDTGFPGMRVLHFAFSGDDANPHLPIHHIEHAVAYAGTHDNDTTRGWWDTLGEETREEVRARLSVRGDRIAWELCEATLGSRADLAVLTAQDLLDQPSSARMNTPATDAGNWRWRLSEGALTEQLAARVRDALERSGRIAEAALRPRL